MSHIPKASDRCQFTYASGRRCRMTKVAPEAKLCFHHWEREQLEDAAAKSAQQIISDDAPLDTAKQIFGALGNVFRLLAQNRIPPRNAAILGYVGQTMLANCPTFQSDLKLLYDDVLLLSKLGILSRKMDKMDRENRPNELFARDLEIFERIVKIAGHCASLTPEEQQIVNHIADRVARRYAGNKPPQAQPESPPAPPPAPQPVACPECAERAAPEAAPSTPQTDSSAEPAPEPVST